MGTHTNKSKSTNEHTKHKLRLNTQKTLGPNGMYELVLVAVHMENFQCTDYRLNARDHLNCSPLLVS